MCGCAGVGSVMSLCLCCDRVRVALCARGVARCCLVVVMVYDDAVWGY